MVEIFKGCTIQSDEQVDKIIDSEEHVDARNWLRNDSSKQVDAISDSEILFLDGSDPKINPRVATHTTNGVSATHTTNGISTQKLLINSTKQDVVGPITPLVTTGVVGALNILSPLQTVVPQANVTVAARSFALIYRIPGKVGGTERDGATPRGATSSETNHRLSLQNPSFVFTSVYPAHSGTKILSIQGTPVVSLKGTGVPSHSTLALMDIWTKIDTLRASSVM